MVSPFEELGLSPQLIQAVEQLGYTQPTPIQSAAIPALLAKRDVLGQAQTGTGKTAAFALPMLQNIQAGKGCVQALVLAPTRELAVQVAAATKGMAGHTPLRVMAVYGGQAYQIQTRQLERGVDVVVGTPGRMLDLIRQNLLDLSQVSYLVLDEADEMLEMGFIEDVETILKQLQGEHQTALFSATLPSAIRKLAERYLKNPERIMINPAKMTVAETEQRYCRVREDSKTAVLVRLLEMEDVKSALIFARTKARAQDLADELERRGFPAASLHGDLNQARRETVLNRFRQRSITLLVATDVAARGLDIEDVSHVFNFDIPQDAEDYVHRIGRTGRAGRKGVAITFFTQRERPRLGQIEAYTHQQVTEFPVPNREAVMARRDERFMAHLVEQMLRPASPEERGMLERLAEAQLDIADVALAAIRMSRTQEFKQPLEEITQPAEYRTSRKDGVETRTRSVAHRSITIETPEVKSAGKGAERAKSGGAGKSARSVPFETPRKGKDGAAPLAARGKRPEEEGMVRLWMNLGNVHGVHPSDVVGAIAGEVGIPGRAIGEIDIRNDFTFVDVAEKHVRQALTSSTGRYFLRGKPVMLKLAS